jgi:hypothetical protein
MYLRQLSSSQIPILIKPLIHSTTRTFTIQTLLPKYITPILLNQPSSINQSSDPHSKCVSQPSPPPLPSWPSHLPPMPTSLMMRLVSSVVQPPLWHRGAPATTGSVYNSAAEASSVAAFISSDYADYASITSQIPSLQSAINSMATASASDKPALSGFQSVLSSVQTMNSAQASAAIQSDISSAFSGRPTYTVVPSGSKAGAAPTRTAAPIFGAAIAGAAWMMIYSRDGRLSFLDEI